MSKGVLINFYSPLFFKKDKSLYYEYESIMKNVAKEVKKALNERIDYTLCDHSRVFIVQIKELQNQLILKGYKCTLTSPNWKTLMQVDADMILTRNGNKSYVNISTRKRATDSKYVQVKIGDFDETYSIFDDEKVNELCIICPPAINSDPYGHTVDNSKACFLRKKIY